MRCSRIHQRTRAAISQWGAETPSHLSDETLIFNKGGKRWGCSEGKTGQYGGSNLKKPFKQEGLLYVQTKLELLEEASTACVYSRFKGEWENGSWREAPGRHYVLNDKSGTFQTQSATSLCTGWRFIMLNPQCSSM